MVTCQQLNGFISIKVIDVDVFKGFQMKLNLLEVNFGNYFLPGNTSGSFCAIMMMQSLKPPVSIYNKYIEYQSDSHILITYSLPTILPLYYLTLTIFHQAVQPNLYVVLGLHLHVRLQQTVSTTIIC